MYVRMSIAAVVTAFVILAALTLAPSPVALSQSSPSLSARKGAVKFAG